MSRRSSLNVGLVTKKKKNNKKNQKNIYTVRTENRNLKTLHPRRNLRSRTTELGVRRRRVERERKREMENCIFPDGNERDGSGREEKRVNRRKVPIGKRLIRFLRPQNL